MIEEQYKRAKDILSEHKLKVEKLGSELLINEVIFKTDLERIFGERKWKSYEEQELIKLEEKRVSKKKSKTKNDKTS